MKEAGTHIIDNIVKLTTYSVVHVFTTETAFLISNQETIDVSHYKLLVDSDIQMVELKEV